MRVHLLCHDLQILLQCNPHLLQDSHADLFSDALSFTRIRLAEHMQESLGIVYGCSCDFAVSLQINRLMHQRRFALYPVQYIYSRSHKTFPQNCIITKQSKQARKSKFQLALCFATLRCHSDTLEVASEAISSVLQSHLRMSSMQQWMRENGCTCETNLATRLLNTMATLRRYSSGVLVYHLPNQ